jgi:hypothetical protein
MTGAEKKLLPGLTVLFVLIYHLRRRDDGVIDPDMSGD